MTSFCWRSTNLDKALVWFSRSVVLEATVHGVRTGHAPHGAWDRHHSCEFASEKSIPGAVFTTCCQTREATEFASSFQEPWWQLLCVLMAVLCLSPYETKMSVLNSLTVTNCIGQGFHEKLQFLTSKQIHLPLWILQVLCRVQRQVLNELISSHFNPVLILKKNKLNSVVWVPDRTIPTERPSLVGEVSATWSAWRIPTAVLSAF
jgi:hypothetical protein